MTLAWQVRGANLRELGMKKISAFGNRIIESLGENAREFQEAKQALLDSRPVILAYNRDGKLQAVSGQCHSRFTTLAPYIQRLLHQNAVPWAIELLRARQPHCSASRVPPLACVLAHHWAPKVTVEGLKFVGRGAGDVPMCLDVGCHLSQHRVRKIKHLPRRVDKPAKK